MDHSEVEKISFFSKFLGSCGLEHNVAACHFDKMPSSLSTGCLVKKHLGTNGSDCYGNV